MVQRYGAASGLRRSEASDKDDSAQRMRTTMDTPTKGKTFNLSDMLAGNSVELGVGYNQDMSTGANTGVRVLATKPGRRRKGA